MKWRLLAAFAGLITLVLVAQDVPLANYLRTIEKERLLANPLAFVDAYVARSQQPMALAR